MIKPYMPDINDAGVFLREIERDWRLNAIVDKELRVYEHLLPKIISREELVTVRFSPHGVRVPEGFTKTPIITTRPDDPDYRKHVGYVGIPLVIVAHLKDFPEGLAMLDEYNSKEEMVQDLSRIYKRDLRPNDVLSAYFLVELGALDPDKRKRYLDRDQ
ncbi:hypothetical protein KY310_02870 [Candidatus Woesearchaeota archaeon]|nr:hypothetical protein [Candidatus Woesearchaeota archaeon]